MQESKLRYTLSLLVIALVIGGSLSSCASGPTTEEESNTAEVKEANAATDAVPTAGEQPGAQAPGAKVAEASPTPDTAAAPPPATTTASAEAPVPPPVAAQAPAAAEAVPPPPATMAESAPPASPPTESGPSRAYRVVAGDTLMKIAFENYGDLYKWRTIYEANRTAIRNPSSLPAGLSLQLPNAPTQLTIERNGERYLIRTGDTLGLISNEVYGVRSKWKRLWENNRQMIKDPNRIYAGFTLYYTMTDDDRSELERFRKGAKQAPPLADAPARLTPKGDPGLSRAPASTVSRAPMGGAPSAGSATKTNGAAASGGGSPAKSSGKGAASPVGGG